MIDLNWLYFRIACFRVIRSIDLEKMQLTSRNAKTDLYFVFMLGITRMSEMFATGFVFALHLLQFNIKEGEKLKGVYISRPIYHTVVTEEAKRISIKHWLAIPFIKILSRLT